MKRTRYLLLFFNSIPRVLLVSFLFLSSIPGSFSSRAVTLGSIQIFETHEFLAPTPTIYFYCKGENKTILPGVKEKHFFYTFNGEQSWQPLTEFLDKKCKRCGLYEMGILSSDDVFDEWELCPDDFVNGESTHSKEEFDAVFMCEECRSSDSARTSTSKRKSAERQINVALVIVIGTTVSVIAVVGAVGAYKYWQKRERAKDQARFLGLFEEGDDIEDKLGLGPMI